MGLTIPRRLTTEGVHPFDTMEWSTRTARITDDKGNVVFEQEVEAPASWSDLAVNIAASKFFYGAQGSPERESSVRDLVGRVGRTIADWADQDGYLIGVEDAWNFRVELLAILVGQYAAFNSPVWFNVGLSQQYGIKGRPEGYRWSGNVGGVVPCRDNHEHPQGSACFIQSVEDDMASIMELARAEAMLFKCGSGTGTDLSTLRSTRERLSGGGKPSGPLSFLKVYDTIAGQVKSGGKTRRAAKMNTLHVRHPDIIEFIEAKTKEEKKAQALIRAGYEANFNGEAYSSVAFQNVNVSVRADDEFMAQCERYRPGFPHADGQTVGAYETVAVTTGRPVDTLAAIDVLAKIAEGTLACGDPGMQFSDTINRWNCVPDLGPINSSNPCSEFVFPDDSACNLASINLMKFRREDGTFDIQLFEHVVRIMLIAMDVLVDRASYPTAKIAENSHKYRPLGLGYANLGAYLMASGLAYDSDKGRSLAAAITSLMGATATQVSAELAQALGPYEGWEANREAHLTVLELHRQADRVLHDALRADAAEALRIEDEADWYDALEDAIGGGVRNAQVTLLAPTGTIGFLMDCDTLGCEPDYSLVKDKHLAGGGTLRIVNQTVRSALMALGYDDTVGSGNPPSWAVGPGSGPAPSQVSDIVDHLRSRGSIGEAPHIRPEHMAVFDCASPDPVTGRSIAWEGHVRLMAAVQPFLSGAISKTVNMPRGSTVEQIMDAYLLAWKLGVKALAIYVDGSKESQPLNTVGGKTEVPTSGPAEHTASYVANWMPYDDLDPYMIGDQSIVAVEGTPDDLGERRWSIRGDDLTGVLGALIPYDPDDGAKELTWTDLLRDLLAEHAEGKDLKAMGPERRRPPETRESVTHKFEIQGHEGYITVGKYPDGSPCEVFITVNKEGSAMAGVYDALSIAVSLGLQHGVPLATILDKFRGLSFPPNGFTGGHEIRQCSSPVDYLARFLERFLRVDPEEVGETPIGRPLAPAVSAPTTESVPLVSRPSGDACAQCGGFDLVPTGPGGRCKQCRSCGNSSGGCG